MMNKRSFFLHSLLFFILLTYLSSCQLSRFVFYNFADIRDHKKFPSRPLLKAENPFKFSVSDATFNPVLNFKTDTISLDNYLKKNNTVAFLIIRNDTILYEKYFGGYNQDRIVPSFSMAKSFLSSLIGFAISDGLIKSVEEPITNYIPELKKNGFEKVQILHLLQMTSGLKFNEGYYNPFGHVASFYYGKKLNKQSVRLKLENGPGEKFKYTSGNSQLLGMVLSRALKGKSITDYLQEKLWTPLGMEFDASWSIDQKKNGMEKAFCCLNARARDYAKFGRLYLHKGKWNQQQLLAENWIDKSVRADRSGGGAGYYQYQWWMNSTKEGDYMAAGILGQYIYINPKKNMIIVRLGKNEGKVNWGSFFLSVCNMSQKSAD